MNKFIKAILVILSLVLLAGLVMVLGLLVSIPGLSSFAAMVMNSFAWMPVALAVVVLFFIVFTLVFLLCDFFLPNPKDNYTIERDMGNIELSGKSIESVAGMAMSEVPGVRRYSAKVKGTPRPGSIKLELRVELDNSVGLSTTSSDVQDHVAQRLAESLDAQPRDIHVHVSPFEDVRQSKTAPRVV